MMQILVANGVNLDLLGRREPEIYGHLSLKFLEDELLSFSDTLRPMFGFDFELIFFQSNDESAFLQTLSSKDWAGILINPAAWTHTSLALADRLKALKLPYVEVHMSNIAAREAFRHHSFSAPAASGVVFGMGLHSYFSGLLGLLFCIEQSKAQV